MIYSYYKLFDNDVMHIVVYYRSFNGNMIQLVLYNWILDDQQLYIRTQIDLPFH
jgi:hypothetical protein